MQHVEKNEGSLGGWRETEVGAKEESGCLGEHVKSEEVTKRKRGKEGWRKHVGLGRCGRGQRAQHPLVRNTKVCVGVFLIVSVR